MKTPVETLTLQQQATLRGYFGALGTSDRAADANPAGTALAAAFAAKLDRQKTAVRELSGHAIRMRSGQTLSRLLSEGQLSTSLLLVGDSMTSGTADTTGGAWPTLFAAQAHAAYPAYRIDLDAWNGSTGFTTTNLYDPGNGLRHLWYPSNTNTNWSIPVAEISSPSANVTEIVCCIEVPDLSTLPTNATINLVTLTGRAALMLYHTTGSTAYIQARAYTPTMNYNSNNVSLTLVAGAKLWIKLQVDGTNGYFNFWTAADSNGAPGSWTHNSTNNPFSTGAGTLGAITACEIGGTGNTQICTGMKFYKAYVNDGVDGPPLFAKHIEAWRPAAVLSNRTYPYFSGDPVLTIISASASGYTIDSWTTTYASKLWCHNKGLGATVFMLGYNHGLDVGPTYTAKLDTLLAQVKALRSDDQFCLIQQPYCAGDQNASVYTGYYNQNLQRRRRQFAWAERNGVGVMDAHAVFRDDSRFAAHPEELWLQKTQNGDWLIHPTSPAPSDAGGSNTGGHYLIASLVADCLL